MEDSIWKPIPGYDGYYEVNQVGMVRSRKNNKIKELKIRNIMGYIGFRLYGKVQFTASAHRLAWEYHNGPIPADHQIHHIDENKRNNAISNLECLYYRDHQGQHKRAVVKSKHVGVYWHQGRWQSRIVVKRRMISIGSFYDELDAHIAYKKVLMELNEGKDIDVLYPKRVKNKHKYISFYGPPLKKKWRVQIKGKNIGGYDSETEAILVRDKYLEKMKINI